MVVIQILLILVVVGRMPATILVSLWEVDWLRVAGADAGAVVGERGGANEGECGGKGKCYPSVGRCGQTWRESGMNVCQRVYEEQSR